MRLAGLRRQRVLVGVVLAALVVVVLTALLGEGAENDVRLDPRNPAPDGTRALVSVLAGRGVEVVVADGAAALSSAPAGPGATVVVSPADALGTSTLRDLRSHADGARVVLLEPGPALWPLLGDGEVAVSTPGSALAADCDPAVADDVADDVAGLEVAVDEAATYPGPGCFRASGGRASLVTRDGVVVLGAAGALTNGEVLRADDAALGLRLLGSGDRLVWYVPDPADLDASEAVTVRSLLPPWVVPGLVLGALSLLLVVGWRARRLGALAREPLPVLVRASETTRSRGRLYRRAGDRAHAAGVLRLAARERLRARLGSATPAEVAARTGRDAADVARLLDDDAPAPASDRDLVMLAQDLHSLDREAPHP